MAAREQQNITTVLSLNHKKIVNKSVRNNIKI